MLRVDKPMQWFRYYSHTPDDKKIKRIKKKTRIGLATVVGTWTILLCLANDSPDRGKLMIAENEWLDDDDLEEETELDTETLQKLLRAYQSLGMMNGKPGQREISNWGKRQFQSDNSTTRVQKHRALKKVQEQIKETDTEADTEGNVPKETLPERSIIPPTPASFTLGDFHDQHAQKARELYTMVTTYPNLPATDKRDQAQQLLEDILDHYKDEFDKGVEEGKQVFAQWCSTISEKGIPYSPLNPAWLEKWLAAILKRPDAPITEYEKAWEPEYTEEERKAKLADQKRQLQEMQDDN